MTIRVTYKKKDGLVQMKHYYNIDHIWIVRGDNGIFNIKLTSITGHVLNAIELTDEIECATMEDDHFLWNLK